MDILGIGECMIELDAAEPLATCNQFTRQVGGDVYNTLVACSRLGSKAGFFSRVAMDGFGHVLINHFDKENIDSRFVQRVSLGRNGLYFASVHPDNSHSFLYYRENSAASQMQPSQMTPQVILETKVVYSSGITQAISPSARKTVLKAFQLAKQQDKLVAYDINFRPGLWKHKDEAMDAMVEVLPFVDVLLPSAEDLKLLFDFEDVPHMLEYFRLKGVPIVALKQGDEGVTLSFRGQEEFIRAYPPETLVDTIGAGDAFNGGFLHGLLQSRSLLECAHTGAIVASSSLQQAGPIAGLPEWHTVSEKPKHLPDKASALSTAGV